MRPFRYRLTGNYWCEIAYSTNGMTVLNTPDWKGRTSWSGTVVPPSTGYAIDPSDIETDWSIRNNNAIQQFPANPTSVNNNILVKNTRLDATAVSNINKIEKSNGEGRFSNGIQFKVIRGYFQVCDDYKRAYLRSIGRPYVMPQDGSIVLYGSSSKTPTGISLKSFNFKYYENAYLGATGESISACKGSINGMDPRFRNDLYNAPGGYDKSVLFTVYVVAEDAGTGLQSDPYVVKFYLHP